MFIELFPANMDGTCSDGLGEDSGVSGVCYLGENWLMHTRYETCKIKPLKN
jgi:hypothetical protein